MDKKTRRGRIAAQQWVVLSHQCPRSYRHPPLRPAFGRHDMTCRPPRAGVAPLTTATTVSRRVHKHGQKHDAGVGGAAARWRQRAKPTQSICKPPTRELHCITTGPT